LGAPNFGPALNSCRLNGLTAISSNGVHGFVQATELEIVGGKIHRIYVVCNPDKARHL